MAAARSGSLLTVLVAVWLLGAGRGEAQIRFDTRALHVEPTLSFAVSSGSDRYLALQVCLYDGDDRVTSATYAGRSFTFLGAMRAGPTAGRIEHWGLVAPPVGTANVVVQNGGGAFIWGVISYAGVHQSMPTRPFAVGTGTGYSPSFTAASAAGDTVVSSLCLTGGSNLMYVEGSRGQTTRGALFTSDYSGAQAELVGAASITTSWRYTGGGTPRWAIATVSLRPASAFGEPDAGPDAAPDAARDAGADVAADTAAPDLAQNEPQPMDLASPVPADATAPAPADRTAPEPPSDDAAVIGGDAATARPLDLSIGCACAAGAPGRPTGGGLTIVLLLAAGLRIASRPR